VNDGKNISQGGRHTLKHVDPCTGAHIHKSNGAFVTNEALGG